MEAAGILELLASADELGQLELDLSHMGFLREELEQGGTPKAEWLRNCLDAALLFDYPLMQIYPDAAKVNIKRLSLFVVVSDDQMLLRVNLAKLLHLPGENTGRELLACKAFLEEFLSTMEADAKGRAMLTVLNHRDHHRRTYGRLRLKVEGLDEQKAEQHVAEALQKHPWAQQWLTNLAKDLNKLGPYSWTRITLEQLVGEHRWTERYLLSQLRKSA